MGEAPLDNPVWEALNGPHARFGVRLRQAARYDLDVVPIGALEEPTPGALRDLAELVETGRHVAIPWFDPNAELGADWELRVRLELLQMVCRAPCEGAKDGLEPLACEDGAELLALAELTQPGPFTARSVELGGFLGVRDGGRIVAMAGRRFAPPGFIEVSGVCTHPSARGRGLAEKLVRAVTAAIQEEGAVAFLHVATASPSVKTSTALYRRLGYEPRRTVSLAVLQRASP